MALLKNIPIKWKLAMALIATGLVLVGSYVLIAKRVFEADKISYVFDAQSSRLESAKNEIEIKFQRALLSARSVIATFDLSTGRPTSVGKQIYEEDQALLGLEVWNETKKQSLLRLEKKSSVLPPLEVHPEQTPLGQISLQVTEEGHFLITLRYDQGDLGIYRMRAALAISEVTPKSRPSESMAVLRQNTLVARIDQRGIPVVIFEKLAQELSGDLHEQTTRIWETDGLRFLVSTVPLELADLRLVVITPESEALGALSTLFNRSMIFLFLSAFGLVMVSLSMARGLTSDLRILTKSAEAIGAGQFDRPPAVDSGDEMGLLSKAFSKMSQEIKRLLAETKEKARMEQELKTASFVQEKLLPRVSTMTFGEIELSGIVVTSSECGGDWWYYFSHGDDLYIAIADATGHGTPAALITAAARSLFSRLERETMTLSQMLKAWDEAVASCSQGELFMTGLLFCINSKTGQGAFVNAAHEAPILLRPSLDGSYNHDSLVLDSSVRIGDNISPEIQEQSFSLGVNEAMILYTDGLFSITHQDGRTLSEKRFSRKLAKKARVFHSAQNLTELVLAEFNEFREGQPLPDDVSVVVLRRTVSRPGALQGPEAEGLLDQQYGL